MRRAFIALPVGAALIGGYVVWSLKSADVPLSASRPAEPGPGIAGPAPVTRPAAENLELRELLEPGPILKPSARTVALAGQRVRMVGFMAHMELPPTGGFYLVPRPVHCDEAGGGTADLPPESVLVVARSAAGQTVSFIDGPLEVTGILEVGNRVDADGRVSAIRLLLDGPVGEHVSRSAEPKPKDPSLL